MMEDREYLSVAEFAERAGVSSQAIYQRLNKSLQCYAKVLNGRKVIDSAALSLYRDVEKENKCGSGLDCQVMLVQEMQAEIQHLKEQILIKDEALRREQEQNQSLTKLLKAFQEQLTAAQALHAGTIKAQQMQQSVEMEEEVKSDNEVQKQQSSEESCPMASSENDRATVFKKRGFFSRFFRFRD